MGNLSTVDGVIALIILILIGLVSYIDKKPRRK